MVRLLILGSTGSIGTTCLNCLRTHSLPVTVVGVTAAHSRDKLESISEEFNCQSLLTGDDIASSGLALFIDRTEPTMVLNAIAGFDGLYATKCVLERGINLSLANKESVVSGACFIFRLAEETGARIIPVDSEHSAIYNLLKDRKASSLVITASGGPFIDREDLSDVRIEDALRHPTWKMGRKITIDSATLANKGLEVMEASYLFGFSPDRIEVTIHRQSVVHSLIRTEEGAVYAQLSPPDMTLPIMSAVSDRKLELKDIVRPLSFRNLALTFEEPDTDRFPLLSYAYRALGIGYAGGIIFNASDEIAVNAFLNGEIRFNEIEKVVKYSLDNKSLTSDNPFSYEDVLSLDRRTREFSSSIIKDKPWRE